MNELKIRNIGLYFYNSCYNFEYLFNIFIKVLQLFTVKAFNSNSSTIQCIGLTLNWWKASEMDLNRLTLKPHPFIFVLTND